MMNSSVRSLIGCFESRQFYGPSYVGSTSIMALQGLCRTNRDILFIGVCDSTHGRKKNPFMFSLPKQWFLTKYT